jgi:hypothetical protein
VTGPEDALERAREAAARGREEGLYPDATPGALDATISDDRPSPELLREWAVIEVDPGAVYSTRRAGAAITPFKRLLMRLLRQYHVEVEAQQTRFNIALLTHLRDLETRVARMERERRG